MAAFKVGIKIKIYKTKVKKKNGVLYIRFHGARRTDGSSGTFTGKNVVNFELSFRIFFQLYWEKYCFFVRVGRKNSGAKPRPNQSEVLIQKHGGTAAFESGK